MSYPWSELDYVMAEKLCSGFIERNCWSIRLRCESRRSVSEGQPGNEVICVDIFGAIVNELLNGQRGAGICSLWTVP